MASGKMVQIHTGCQVGQPVDAFLHTPGIPVKRAAVGDISAVPTAASLGARHPSLSRGTIPQLLPALGSSTLSTNPVYLTNCEVSSGLLSEACNNSLWPHKLLTPARWPSPAGPFRPRTACHLPELRFWRRD